MDNAFLPLSPEVTVIAGYSRAQALADGVLIDVSELAAEAGFVIPVAVTDGAWMDCVEWTPQDSRRQGVQDTHGRLWDLLTTAYWMIRWSRAPSNPLWFDLEAHTARRKVSPTGADHPEIRPGSG